MRVAPSQHEIRECAERKQICALIEKLQQLKLVKRSADARSLGELIFNNMNMMFIEFVKRDEATIAELRGAIRRQNRVVVETVGS